VKSTLHCAASFFHGRTSRGISLLAFSALLLGFAAGCRSKPPAKVETHLTSTEKQGQAVFDNYCAGCHYPYSTKTLVGPGLQGLYSKKYLPSGAPANDDRVRATIQDGRAGGMPPFGNVLSDEQIKDLIAYLHTL
jgi:mono/diheme cytochrome c family protein